MKIRTRAFIGLWLIYILAAAAIALIAVSYTTSARMDAEQARVSEVLNLHGTMWRALVEARTNHLAYSLTGAPALRERRDDHRRIYGGAIAMLSSNVRDSGQLDRINRIRARVSAWTAAGEPVALTGGNAVDRDAVIRRSAADFADINRDLIEFDAYERESLRRISRQINELRTTMALGRACLLYTSDAADE